MNNDIEQVVSSCSTCQLHLWSQQPEPLVHSTSSQPFESVSVDLFESACAHYLIMVHRFLGWPCISRLGRMGTRAVTDILRDWFVDYGVPQIIRSDGGPQFRSEFQDFCRDMHITHQLSSAYHPASNGHAESAVKSMKMLLQKYENNWRYFRQSLLEWRNVPRADGLSPAQWLFGRRLRTQVPGHPASYDCLSDGDFLAALSKRNVDKGKVQDNFNARSSVLTPLSPNTNVLVQDPHSKKWNQSATVIRVRENGQSYLSYLL
ncbi:uncharacterized protein K02A2.6-like [Tigriopus californicus]|uniref:uncharacterized protein K02A2.6-like n=1 Tax=Tigriopus californicus TaxID=6832 RepID=UPI0027DA5784|nr:uncharacterized protein K02A2.6-like [Tigriopus californicus]